MIQVEFSEDPLVFEKVLPLSSSYRCQLVYSGRAIGEGGLEFVVDTETVRLLLHSLGNDLMAKLGEIFKATVYHRIGHVSHGELTGLIVTEADHHDVAFNVERSIIECMKHRCPIWKYEKDGGELSWTARHEKYGVSI